VFHDPRRFGLCVVDDEHESKLVAGMGPEPLDPESFNETYFEPFRRSTKRTVKDVLMDQRVVAGLGNIYVNEILFRAGVRPRRGMARVSRDECARIVTHTREVIADAIEHRGSTISDFLDGIGIAFTIGKGSRVRSAERRSRRWWWGRGRASTVRTARNRRSTRSVSSRPGLTACGEAARCKRARSSPERRDDRWQGRH
jgi:DNA-formamidopyrimidine glycosylase